MIKCEIILNGYVYDATNDLVNWDDVEMKWKRNDFDGVVRSFTTKFEFAGSTYSLLVSEFIKNMLNASASIVFYTRNNSWLWNERFRCALDFSTFSYNGNTCEINAIDDTLAAKIKANKSTKYEYNVSELSEKDLDYDRLEMKSQVTWIFPFSSDEETTVKLIYNHENYIPLYVEKSDIYTKNVVEVNDVGIGEEIPFITCSKSQLIHLSCILTLQFGDLVNATVELISNIPGDIDVLLYSGPVLSSSANIDMDIFMVPGQTLRLIYHPYWVGAGHEKHYLTNITGIAPKITFLSKSDTVKIPTISPIKLLNRILESINSDSGSITGEIVNPTYALQRTFILPAESIRGISQAKIYTSYKDFQEWMFAVFGFVPVIGDNKVSFVHMDTLFVDKQAKDIGNTSEFELSLDSGMVHSSVKVGYNKKDYDSVNGRDEFRFTTEYTTGTKLTDSSLELISPYRADAYGIEFLAQKRGEDTTDSSSDKDIFFVMVQSTDESVLHLERGQTITGVISPETMFNNLYAAPYMITAHYNYLRALGQKLFFASSDGNSDVKINSFALNADLELPNTALFLPARATFITDDSSIPDDLSGYISFVHQGKQYKGYVSEITLNIGRLESVKYELIVKSIEDA